MTIRQQASYRLAKGTKKSWVVSVTLRSKRYHIKPRVITSTVEKILATLNFDSITSQKTVGLDIILCGDAYIRRLNKKYRGKDKATDVLSFPYWEGTAPNLVTHLGDLVISVPRLKRQAQEFEVNEYQELLRLLIHGILHLAGYDHEKVSRAEAKKMQQLENRIYVRFLKSSRTMIL
jgi:probable rRNA maturation factor